MIVFEDLKKVKKVQSMINSKIEKIKQLEANIDGLKSQKIAEKTQGGKAHINYQEYRAEEIERLKSEIWELSDYQNKVWHQINRLANSMERTLLIDEYILGNNAVERLRRKKGDRIGYTKKELIEILKQAEFNFMVLCMSESVS